MKKKCIVIAGPTATGKSRVAVLLAKKIKGSVISADSMQIYKGMDIGTAKITKEETEDVPHYLIDELDPKEEYNVVRFQEMAKRAIDEIFSAGRIPIITGGTGFYIQALVRDVDFTSTGHVKGLRLKYEGISKEEGAGRLYELLKQKDEAAALKIHPNNIKRIIRALEFYDETGDMISRHNAEQSQKSSPYDCLYFVLSDDRKALYERIDRRVDKMMEQGLLDEVEKLYKAGLREDDVSMKGIGYREFFPFFKGEYSLEDCILKIKSDTRHFAKRQLTWFKREKEAIWIERHEYENEEAIAASIFEMIKEAWGKHAAIGDSLNEQG